MVSKTLIVLFSMLVVVSGLCFAASSTISSTVVYASNDSYVPDANVSLYNMSFNQDGPPTRVLVNSTLTNSTGGFSLTFDNETGAQTMFLLDIKKYNSTSAPQRLEFINQPIPDMPVFEFGPIFTTMNNMNMSIGLIPAATLRINATNSSGDTANFGYFMKDKSHMGDKGWSNNATNATFYIDSSKNYVVTVFQMRNITGREPGAFPRSIMVYSSNLTNDAVDGVFSLSINLSPSISFVSGNLSVSGNSTPVNFTDIVFYSLTDGEVFYGSQGRPLNPRGMGGNAPSNDGVGIAMDGRVGNYSVSLPSASDDGISYLMVAYAKNSSSYYAAFQNVTMVAGSNRTINVTLRSLIGNYAETGYSDDVNSLKFKVYLNDSTNGTVISNNPGMFEANISDYNTYGAVTYRLMVGANSSGTFLFPVLNNSNITYQIFTMGKAPRKGTLNYTASNSSVIEMNSMEFKDPDGSTFNAMRIEFFYSNATCDVQQPPSNCLITNFSVNSGPKGDSFHPLAFTLAGRNLSMRMSETTTGITVFLSNVDLMASGPPNAEFDNEAETVTGSATSLERAWRIGSFAPRVFSTAFVGLSYSDSEVDDSQPIRILLKSLYDDNWNEIWNTTGHPNADSIPAYYADYNASLLNASTNGVLCNTTNTTEVCFVNTSTNTIWISIPHFSGSRPSISASLVTSSSSRTRSESSRRMDVTVESSACPEEQLIVTVSAAGTPIYDAEVRLNYPITDFEEKNTDSDGKVVFDVSSVSPKSGEYQVIVAASGHTKVDTRFNYAGCVAEAAAVQPEEAQAVTEEPQQEQPETAAVETAPGAEATVSPSMSVSDQEVAGDEVVIASVYLDRPGYVAIRIISPEGMLGDFVGASELLTGEVQSLNVPVSGYGDATRLAAILFYDDGDGSWNAASEEMVGVDGTVVMSTFTVSTPASAGEETEPSVQETTATETAKPATSTQEKPADYTWLIVVGVVIVIGAVLFLGGGAAYLMGKKK